MRFKLLIFIVLVFATVSSCKPEKPAQPPPPPEVRVIVVEAREVTVPIEFVGQIYGAEDITIRARVEGFLEGIHFEEGSEVEAGRLLYTLESQPYDAEVAAMMSRVAEAKTILAKTTSDLKRVRPLAARKAVSQADLDAAIAAQEASEASVEAAQANLKAAKINLSYTKIHSPITGIIGKTNARVGDFVGRSPNPVILNTVSNIATVRAQFFLTENQYLQLARRILQLQQEEAQETERGKFKLILADGSLYPHDGSFDFIDRNIDPFTGSILVQVSFPNPDKIIRPGQFARIRTVADRVKDGILIPQRCVSELQGLTRVFVVGENDKVEERRVEVGPVIGSAWLIYEGLSAGEMIVYEGLQKVTDGAIVNPTIVSIESIEKSKQ